MDGVNKPIQSELLSNQRLLLAGAHVLKELEVVRRRAHTLRARARLANLRVARSRNAIR